MVKHQYDAIIVGAGGAGLRAALEIPEGFSCAVLSKVFPTRSHTGAAQGGIGAALGNEEEDSWEWHMFDTVKGSDYLGDQDAIEIMTKDAIRAIIELEHMGMPFSRTPEGKIAQRKFGGHTKPENPSDPDSKRIAVKRSCYSADRTGHVMLHTLYENCIKQKVHFYSEFFVTDLIMSGNVCAGVVAIEIATSEVHVFHAKAVMLATGGYGRIYRITSNAHVGTGDGFAHVYNNGLPLQDMEFVQFHPTGLWKLGILISEAARGEGGILLNSKGERFMERYAPTVKDLAPRDMVSRAILTEIREGRGIKGSDGTYYVNLDLTHLPKEVIDDKLPEITGFARTYLGVEPTKEPIPIQPTAHYAMGGIPTTPDAEVTKDKKKTVIPGLYAAGEAACVSVHGGNRLGTNSLLDLIVFGRRGGKAIAKFIAGAEFAPLPGDAADKTISKIDRVQNSTGSEKPGSLRTEMQEKMMEKVGIFRNEKDLTEMTSEIKNLRDRYQKIAIDDKGKIFNTDMMEAIELGNLIDTAEAITHSALARQESRGAHSREDYPNRDDKKWLKHTLIYKTDGEPKLDYKPVSITRFQPKERKY